MIRSGAVTLSLLVAIAAAASAQTHSGSHARPYSHVPGHVRPDSATHAAMHALLHGSWTGTLTSPHGESSGMVLSVAGDSARGRLALTVSTADPKRGGPARDVVVDGDTLRWTQDLSGTSCKASALVTSATPSVPQALTGRMACENVESTFTLHKKAG